MARSPPAIRPCGTFVIQRFRSKVEHVDTSVIVSLVVVGVFLVMALFPGLAAPWDPQTCLLIRSLAPVDFPAHPFGFDIQGCDLLGLSIVGARYSMVAGLGATLIAASVALPFGALAGMVGGWFDAVVSRIVELVIGLPIVLVALVFLTGLEERGLPLVMLVLAIAAWPIHTRVVRASAMRISREPFVDAARAMGASRRHLLLRHVLPGSMGSLLAVIPTTAAFSIGVEALLSFLGAGLRLPAVSWGVLLGEAQLNIRRAPHLLTPGIFLVAVSAALVVLGEAWRHRDLGGERMALRRVRRDEASREKPAQEQVLPSVIYVEPSRRDAP